MPLYNTPQSGGQLTSMIPGAGLFTLFSGTETPVQGIRSVAFSLGYNPGGGVFNKTFSVSGCPSSAAIQICASNLDVAGDYVVIATLTPDANGNAIYTDQGVAKFYTAVLSAYSTGAMPAVTVNM